MPIRVAIVGMGYVANTLVAGVERIRAGEIKPYGVPFADALVYKIGDIEFVAGFDIDDNKVGKPISEVVKMYYPDFKAVERVSKVVVERGLHYKSTEGLPFKSRGLEEEMPPAKAIDAFVEKLAAAKPEIVINLITTEKTDRVESFKDLEEKVLSGKASASQAYAYALLRYAESVGRVVYVNAIPATIARDPVIVEEFEKRNSIVLGDDGASGATPLTSDLLEHLAERGRYVKSIVQFNIGGNTDFLALMNPERNKAKEQTKSSIVKDILGYDAPHFIKPTGYLEPLGDKKFVSMHIEYISFNGAVDELFVNARINDSPALAGLLVDVIRLAKVALEKKLAGTIYPINAFFMKDPGPAGAPSISRIVAYQLLMKWCEKYGAFSEKYRYTVYDLEKKYL